jgi:hypothetical protein
MPLFLLNWRVWASVVILCALAAGAYKINAAADLRGQAKVMARWNAQIAVDNKAVLEKEAHLNAQIKEAQHVAEIRQNENSLAADNARVVVDGLRNKITTLNKRIPQLTRTAVNQYAATAAEVFSECSRSYQELARTADELSTDRQTLIASWPN